MENQIGNYSNGESLVTMTYMYNMSETYVKTSRVLITTIYK